VGPRAETTGINTLDWIIVGIVVLTALGGYKRGVVGTVLSLAGLILGSTVGSRLAPHFLSGGAHSRYTALIGLVGAFIGIAVFQVLTSILAKSIRGGLHFLPPLHLLDSLGGLAIGAVWGLALAWVAGAVVLQVPGHKQWKHDVRHSKIERRLDKIAPPHDLLRVQKRFLAIASQMSTRIEDEVNRP
jgi:uncharacterized membrane protein required for colicin V production